MSKNVCYHCGEPCGRKEVMYDQKSFCCSGCKMVYEIFTTNDLDYYYEIQANAGTTPNLVKEKFSFLENEAIVEKLVTFDEEGTQVVSLSIPSIHCSSCIWVLENLNKLHAAIMFSQVDFPKKEIRITYSTKNFSLKELVVLLAKIGYEPHISLEDVQEKNKKVNRSLLYKLGVAGFAFGNVMLLSFPEYFEVQEFWLDQYKHLFRWVMFGFSIPVVLYAASDYFVSAYKGLRSGFLNIDVPISLGVLALFLRSTIDIALDLGSGFFDSLTGLIFFLLLGKFFQQRTYAYLSFERDYKSYFPIGVTKINASGEEEAVALEEVKKGDRLLIRNQEIIPVDGLLLSESAEIDYSFVTGESLPVFKQSHDVLYAGGKQLSSSIEIEVVKTVAQSYLTKLWSNAAFKKNKVTDFQSLTDRIGKRFTIAVLTIATIATLYWWWVDPSKAINVFTAVLIIACPCAIALAAPFTLGNMLRIFGRSKFFVKNANVVERFAQINAVIFDKTGTLTSTQKNTIVYEGLELSAEEAGLLKNTLRSSNHPLSRALYAILEANEITTLDAFSEHTGQGVEGKLRTQSIKAGSASFVGYNGPTATTNTAVHISSNNQYKGQFLIKNEYRQGIGKLFQRLLHKNLVLAILSGDNDQEREHIQSLVQRKIPMFFNQKPEDKLNFVRNFQKAHSVVMVGDGLNDAGALAQSDVGIAVSEDVNVFTPACDAILEASQLQKIPDFIALSKSAMQIIKLSFLLSFCYNIIGLYFAVTGQLQPVIAAILMPLSSISIVLFTTIATNIIGRKIRDRT